MVESRDTKVLDADDEGAGTGVTATEQTRVVIGDHEANDEGGDAIEESKTVDETPCSLGDVPARSDCLTSSNSDELRASDESETSGDNSVPVAKKMTRSATGIVFRECAWIIPIAETSRSVLANTEGDAETENDQTHDSNQLDTGEPELSFTEDGDGNNVECESNEQYDKDPEPNADGRFPKS